MEKKRDIEIKLFFLWNVLWWKRENEEGQSKSYPTDKFVYSKNIWKEVSYVGFSFCCPAGTNWEYPEGFEGTKGTENFINWLPGRISVNYF